MSDDNDPRTTHDTSWDSGWDSGWNTGVQGYDEPMTGPLDAPERPSGFHPVNVGHLVMGVAFTGLLVVWALFQADVVDADELRWLMPIPWLTAGAAGVAASVWSSRRS